MAESKVALITSAAQELDWTLPNFCLEMEQGWVHVCVQILA